MDSADEEIGKPVAEFFGVTIDKPKVSVITFLFLTVSFHVVILRVAIMYIVLWDRLLLSQLLMSNQLNTYSKMRLRLRKLRFDILPYTMTLFLIDIQC